MDNRLRNFIGGSSLWMIPFTILMATIIIASVDILLPFLSFNVNQMTWLWIISTTVSLILSSFMAERISLTGRRVALFMLLAAAVSSVIYTELSNFIKWDVVDAVLGVIPIPLFGGVVYTITLALVPGGITGVILGGVFGLSTGIPRLKNKASDLSNLKTSNKRQWSGFEKICKRCGHTSPFESSFCPFCGIELLRKHAPPIRFCRFCGSRIYLVGKFCPECGREITILSKPSVYISQ
jgi:RNA polymerase subunit RPABC4/transcription elongation factor Spt4